jgi:hypothetical protein
MIRAGIISLQRLDADQSAGAPAAAFWTIASFQPAPINSA